MIWVIRSLSFLRTTFFLLGIGVVFIPVISSGQAKPSAADMGAWYENASEAESIQDPTIKGMLKECLDAQKSSVGACNEDTSPFAQAAMGALQAMLPMMMQSKGQKIDCNKASEAQKQAQQQMGQGMPGCGGGGQPGGGQGGQGDQGGQGGGNNMASDCGGKAGAGQEKCSKAKKDIEGIEKSCDGKPSEAQKAQCKKDVATGKKVADKGSQANQKMGTANLSQIMQMIGQLMCQMKKADQCQKDVCSAPGQKKYDPADPAVASGGSQGGSDKILQDDEGCLVDCNAILNTQPQADPKYPEWTAKNAARFAKFKAMCECQMTPGMAHCGGKPNENQAGNGNPRTEKGNKRLNVEDPTDPNSSDRSPGENAPYSSSGSGSSGASGPGGGAGLSPSGGGSAAKDNKRLAAPKPMEVSAGFEGGGGGGSKSSGSSADAPLGKYQKYLPNQRAPGSAQGVRAEITGAGGKSIWEKMNEAYRTTAPSLNR